MYYYKSSEQKRGNFKDYVVLPDNIGSLNRTHKIIALNNANERIQSSVMAIAFNYSRSDNQRAERRAKR